MSANGNSRDPIWNLEPNPPQWALDAGLPYPEQDEVLGDYCERIGLSYWRLIEGLDRRCATANVHIRLVNMIAESCPEAWREHVDEFVKTYRR
jgi:hypothetical protein